MANNWRYYQETGHAGGTTTLQYVDSFNGDDANSGSYDAPKRSIQGALDVGANNMIIICAGYFNEGDFLNKRHRISLISEGFVILDGTDKLTFNPNLYIPISFNGIVNEGSVFSFGHFLFKNFITNIFGIGVSGASRCYVNGCIFISGVVDLGKVGSHVFERTSNCLFINSSVIIHGSNNRSMFFENNTFVNSSLTVTSSNLVNFHIEHCVFDEASSVDLANSTPNLFDYNAILGTQTEKIRVNGVWYENTEDLQANTSFAQNDLPSTTDPKFNLINDKDYTLKVDSPLRFASDYGSYIGFANYAGVLEADSIEWTVTDIDNTTTPGEAYLTGDEPIGIMESNVVQLFDKEREITRIMMPDFAHNPSMGETIGRLANFNTPYLISLEIQWGDNAIDMNGTWVRVPIGTRPLYDKVNEVGNDDPAFDIDNAVSIAAKFIKYRVTLRSNETPI